jgi:NitT/TauT family transport system ATP-binding protein
VLVMAARPGRIVAEQVVDAPYPREPAFRHSPVFHAACARIAATMEAASQGLAQP